jgi:hypothetical protein
MNRFNCCLGWIGCLVLVGGFAGSAVAQPATNEASKVSSVRAELTATAKELGIPFSRYTTTDTLGRKIIPSVTVANKTLPLILFIDGSGCQSLFQKVGDRIGGGMHNLLLLAARGSAHVIVVEKPGVQFLDNPRQPGSAEGASNDFMQEHTLPRWAEANRAALLAARTLSNVDLSKSANRRC